MRLGWTAAAGAGLPAGKTPVATLALLQVDHSDKFVKGDWIRIFLNDGSTTGQGGDGPGDRRRRLQQSFFSLSMGGDSGSSSEGSTPGKVQLVSEAVPEWMWSSPAFRAAMDGARREGEEGEGFTPEEAAAADAEFWAENYPDRVPAAAAKDTVVAWLYGDGVADSGVRGAVDKDEVYISARRVIGVGLLVFFPSPFGAIKL